MQHFSYDGRNLSEALVVEYDSELVVLSILVACLASYAAFSIASRISAAEKPHQQRSWLSAGAIILGIGVWAMHFIAMLALKIPVVVSYDILVTIASIVPAVLASGVMLFAISRPRPKLLQLYGGGTLMGIGIGTMHYIGMLAITGVERGIIMLFNLRLLVVSLVLAIVLANVALHINAFFNRRHNSDSFALWSRLLCALMMGLAVAGMHYTAMAATYFFPGEATTDAVDHVLNSGSLVFWVSFASLLITSLAIFVTIVDSRLQQMAYDEAMSRSRMREAIESIADGFSLYDKDDRLVECNQRYRELMESSTAILPGTSFEAVIRGAAESDLILDAQGRVEEWVAERLARHRSPRGHFVEHFRNDRWIRVSERRVWHTGTVAILTDITEIKHSEIGLSIAMNLAEEARMAAEQANRAKSAFLANMSHELRTPMNAIIGYSEMLLEEAQEDGREEAVRDLEKIRSAGKHLLSLISEILDLSKIEAGKMELYLEEFELSAVIRDVESTIRPLMQQAENVLEVSLPERLPVMYADLTKLRQILYNLLSNAGKFTQRGHIAFSTALEQVDGREWVCFQVSDTGIGMSQDQIVKVFQAFTQADNSTTRKYGGTGLGLTISKKFCQLMGGDIDVRSQLGVGSVFSIRLPVRCTIKEGD